MFWCRLVFGVSRRQGGGVGCRVLPWFRVFISHGRWADLHSFVISLVGLSGLVPLRVIVLFSRCFDQWRVYFQAWLGGVWRALSASLVPRRCDWRGGDGSAVFSLGLGLVWCRVRRRATMLWGGFSCWGGRQFSWVPSPGWGSVLRRLFYWGFVVVAGVAVFPFSLFSISLHCG